MMQKEASYSILVFACLTAIAGGFLWGRIAAGFFIFGFIGVLDYFVVYVVKGIAKDSESL